jgi:hypothetical protein
LFALSFVTTASAAMPNPCALLTNAEVAKAFGAKIASRTRDATVPGSCTWDGVTLGTFTSAHASLRIDIARITKVEFEKQATKAKNAVPVRGVGELAYSQYTAGETLTVWQQCSCKDTALTETTSPLAAAKTLARAALARL